MRLEYASKEELLDLLVNAVDGIDGYESEKGDLMYWDPKKIERARNLIDQLVSASF
ncbi:MAG: hypothetical protein ACYC1T_06940 [Sulfuricaulis sp.]